MREGKEDIMDWLHSQGVKPDFYQQPNGDLVVTATEGAKPFYPLEQVFRLLPTSSWRGFNGDLIWSCTAVNFFCQIADPVYRPRDPHVAGLRWLKQTIIEYPSIFEFWDKCEPFWIADGLIKEVQE